VAKRRTEPYGPGVVWYKIKNPAYTQVEAAASSSMANVKIGGRLDLGSLLLGACCFVIAAVLV
jgi:hypothetical protein